MRAYFGLLLLADVGPSVEQPATYGMTRQAGISFSYHVCQNYCRLSFDDCFSRPRCRGVDKMAAFWVWDLWLPSPLWGLVQLWTLGWANRAILGKWQYMPMKPAKYGLKSGSPVTYKRIMHGGFLFTPANQLIHPQNEAKDGGPCCTWQRGWEGWLYRVLIFFLLRAGRGASKM